MKFKIFQFVICLSFLLNVLHSQQSMSVFDIIDSTEKQHSGQPIQSVLSVDQTKSDAYRFSQQTTPAPILGPNNIHPNEAPHSTASAGNNLQMMLDKIKSKVTNPFLKDNLTLESVANFFANFVSGNQFVNNLEVKELADFTKLEVKESLKVKNEAQIENLSFNKLKSRAMSIDDNEITFDPEAVLKLKSSKIEFRVKDIFEVITFMKYIVKICGSKLEKCDFNNLIKNRNANQMIQLMSAFDKKQHKFLDTEMGKYKQQAELKKKTELKQKTEIEEEKTEIEEEKKTLINSPSTVNPNKKLNLRKDNTIISLASTNVVNFKQKEESLEDVEKEFKNQIQLAQSNKLNDEYEQFIQNPQIADFMNSYYYDISNTFSP